MNTIFDPQDAIDAPAVTWEQSRQAVLDVLNGRKLRAYGRDAEDWRETLLDEISEVRAEAVRALVGIDLEAWFLAKNHLADAINRHANAWLAEADADELEREGFWV